MKIDYKKKQFNEVIHALTTARDHLCFLSAAYDRDYYDFLSRKDGSEMDEALDKVQIVMERIIERHIKEQCDHTNLDTNICYKCGYPLRENKEKVL